MCLTVMGFLYDVKLLHVLYTVLVIRQHPLQGGMWWHSWLRYCTTSQKFTGLIPDGVIGIFSST
jgi:hypothetical protein